MANQRVAGLIQVKANGEIYDAKGNFSYNLGLPAARGDRRLRRDPRL